MREHTEKLFYSDAYIKKFSAAIISCEPRNEGYSIILDRTAFYPEGGGQPADTGRIGDVRVTDVHERDGLILHYTDKAIDPGMKADCEIDWPGRFSRMQHHSGEHIVSGLVKKNYGFDNVGFHMGSDAVTIDFNGVLTGKELQALEISANDAIYQNLPINVTYPNPEELSSLNYRSKKELNGDVRIVTVPGYDSCACCGTHTATTGEIGIIKLVSSQSYKGGTRMIVLCGSEALKDYYEKNVSVYEISAKLSAKPRDISHAVDTLQNENSELKRRIWELKNKIFEMKARQIGNIDRICIFEDELNANELRQFCVLLCEQTRLAAVLSGTDEQGYKYAIGSLEADAGAVGKDLNSALSGKGGGVKGLAQGSVRASRIDIENFFASREWVIK